MVPARLQARQTMQALFASLQMCSECSMLLQFEAFAKGFMMLCGGPAMHLFSATELERLVCGNPILDFKALETNAWYDGGYNAEHRVRPSISFPFQDAACFAQATLLTVYTRM